MADPCRPISASRRSCASNELIYGVEFEGTAGESPDDEQFTVTRPDGTKLKDAPDSLWWSIGAYAHDTWKVNSCFDLTASARFDMFRFSTEVDRVLRARGWPRPLRRRDRGLAACVRGRPAGDLPPELGARTSTADGLAASGSFAPRFGVTEHAWGVVVPNEFLDPVTADQFEVGLKHRSKHTRFDAIGYYTYFNNFQNVSPGPSRARTGTTTTATGCVMPDEDVYVNDGNGYASLYGVEIDAEMNLAALNEGVFGDAWTVVAGFIYNYGQDDEERHPDAAHAAHAGPVRRALGSVPAGEDQGALGRAACELRGPLRPDPPGSSVGGRRLPRGPAGSDLRQAPEVGSSRLLGVGPPRRLPSEQDVELTVGMLNMFDKLYRPAHARMDAPGRNFFATVSVIF